jgi:hypothetical protein
MTRLNVFLFEWPFPAVVVLALALGFSLRATQWDYLLLGLLAMVLAGYAAYWHQGNLFGPRFLYPALPALLVYSARMPSIVAARLRRPILQRATLALIPICVCTAWIPFQDSSRFSGVWARVESTRASDVYRDVDVAGEVEAARLDNALVFVREPFRERISARLRGLGEPALMAEQIAANVDACALQEGLDADDSMPVGTVHDRLERIVLRAEQAGPAQPLPGRTGNFSLALVGGTPSSPACAQQLALDRSGTLPLELFLPFDDFDGDGRLGGRVVFARDLGPRDELLRAQFGGRRWYRYRPKADPRDTGVVFVPYERGGS